MHLLVANGVIELAIHHIQQADNLWEAIADILHHAHVGFVCPHDDEHDLALVVAAQDERTQLSLVRVFIIKGDTQLACYVAYAVAYAVVDGWHEVALGDVEHLVKAVRDMEAQSMGVVHVLQSACGADGVPTQPFAVGESELQFVAVLVDLFAAKDRGDLGQLDLTDTGEVVDDLLLLVAQLLLVGEDLPLAAATFAIVLAYGFATHRRWLHDTLHATLHEGVFLACHLYIDNIARHAVWHKQHHIIHTGESFALSSNACNLNVL